MISRRSTLVYLANVIGAALGYIGLLVIARLTPNSAEFLGLVGFGLGLVGSFFVLTGLGIPAAHIKRVSEGEPLDQAIGTYAIIRLVQVALSISLALLGLHLWTNVLGRGFESPLHVQVIFVMLVYHSALALGNIGIQTFSARMETAKSQIGLLVGTLARVLGMILVVAAGLGAIELAWAYALGAVATGVSVLVLIWRYPIRLPEWRLVRSYLKYALPLSLPAALVALSANIDKAAIQLFWGAAEVGYYFTVQRIVLLLVVVTSAVSVLLFPSVSRLHAQRDMNGLRTKSAQAERYLSMVLAPIVAFLFIYPEGVLHVMLSDDFLPAANILRIFAIATFVLAIIVPRRALLLGMDRSDLAGKASLAGAVVTLALFPLLIPTSILGVPLAGLGPEGAAFSVLVGYTVLLGLALLFAHRIVGDRLHRNIAVHTLAAAAVGFVFWLALSPASGLTWQWFNLIGYSLLFLGAYLAVLTALGEFRRADLLLFLDILNPRKMARYVRDELTDRREP